MARWGRQAAAAAAAAVAQVRKARTCRTCLPSSMSVESSTAMPQRPTTRKGAQTKSHCRAQCSVRGLLKTIAHRSLAATQIACLQEATVPMLSEMTPRCWSLKQPALCGQNPNQCVAMASITCLPACAAARLATPRAGATRPALSSLGAPRLAAPCRRPALQRRQARARTSVAAAAAATAAQRAACSLPACLLRCT